MSDACWTPIGSLGGFLRTLLTPARPDGQPQPQPLEFSLTYSSAEISPAGIVLRGIARRGGLAGRRTSNSRRSPRRSEDRSGDVIPNGRRVLWLSRAGSRVVPSRASSGSGRASRRPASRTTGSSSSCPRDSSVADGTGADQKRTDARIAAFSPMCLTIRGTRLSSSGAVTPQPVMASYCAFQSVSRCSTPPSSLQVAFRSCR